MPQDSICDVKVLLACIWQHSSVWLKLSWLGSLFSGAEHTWYHRLSVLTSLVKFRQPTFSWILVTWHWKSTSGIVMDIIDVILRAGKYYFRVSSLIEGVHDSDHSWKTIISLQHRELWTSMCEFIVGGERRKSSRVRLPNNPSNPTRIRGDSRDVKASFVLYSEGEESSFDLISISTWGIGYLSMLCWCVLETFKVWILRFISCIRGPFNRATEQLPLDMGTDELAETISG